MKKEIPQSTIRNKSTEKKMSFKSWCLYLQSIVDRVEKMGEVQKTSKKSPKILKRDKRDSGIHFDYIVVDDLLESCSDPEKVKENYNKFLETKLPISSCGVVSSSPIRIHESKIKK